jgi:hypothetical protein
VVEVSNTEAKEGEIKREEQHEKCYCGFEGAEKEQESEDEPALATYCISIQFLCNIS